MKQLKIKKRSESPLLEALDVFEKTMGLKFPQPYRKFLIEQNPYTVEENQFKKDGRAFEVHHFYPFDSTFELSLQKVHSELNSFFENNYLAFADDSGGWQYVISVQEKDFGKVYFCRMDEELPKALTFLANNFEDFIDKLEIESQA